MARVLVVDDEPTLVDTIRYNLRRDGYEVQVAGGGPVPTTGGLELSGRFRITGGTGRFEDLSGTGSLIGQLTCLTSTLQRNAAASCEELGGYSEAPFQLQGRYRDPTLTVA